MANQIKTKSTKYSLAHPFIYNKSFANNSWTCLLWRLLACLKCSISISQLSLKFFQCLNNNKYEILQTFRNIFLWMAFTMQTQRHKISGSTWQIKDSKIFPILLTGLGRSGSTKITRKICSTATWSLCSSNWVEVSHNAFYSASI